MKIGIIRGLGVCLGDRFPAMWKRRRHLAGFILLFVVFFAINQQVLNLPETLRRMLNAFPLGHIVYSDTVIHIFPPEVEIKDASLVDLDQHSVVLRFDKLTIRPELRQFFSGKAAVRATALAGKGYVTLGMATDSFFDLSNISFTLDMENMPLQTLGPLEQFDPDIDGAVSVQAKGKVGLPISSECALAASGSITLASARNSLAALAFARFRNGVFHFDLTIAGYEATIRRMDFADQSCSATLGGRVLIDWDDLPSSELDLSAEIKTRPEHISPGLLMDDNVRRRLGQGESLPLAIKGTFDDVQMKPVF